MNRIGVAAAQYVVETVGPKSATPAYWMNNGTCSLYPWTGQYDFYESMGEVPSTSLAPLELVVE